MNITKNTENIIKNIKQYPHARLAIATKTQKDLHLFTQSIINDDIIIAENRIQEAEEKHKILSQFSNKKHFIGTLQSNKVKKAVEIFDCIETVDSIKLLEKINRISGEYNKITEIFLNINISKDIKKSGIFPENIENFIEKIVALQKNHALEYIQINGIFTILKNNISDSEKSRYYSQMKTLQKNLSTKIPSIQEISMGMSEDYIIALEAGATIVRVGRGIFGERN